MGRLQSMYIKDKFKFFDSSGFMLCVAFFSFFTHCAHFLSDGALYWDTAKIYTEFRDNLQALNHFGEIAWWFPHNQTGTPAYYHSILGIPSLSLPVFATLGVLCWILGRFGVLIHNFHPLYVSYFGLFVPLLLLFSVRALSRRLWAVPLCTGLAFLLTAFSPGIRFHMSDLGYLEPTAYGLFFCAFFIDFHRRPNDGNFWKLVFAASLVTLSGTHAALYWNAYFLPLFVILFRINRGRLRVPQSALKLGIGFFILALPILLNAVVLHQGKELVRSSIGLSQMYPFDRLIPGNPLEALTISLPGFGFDWNSDRSYWKLMPLSNGYHSSLQYLGILALPLFLYTLLRGSQRSKRSLLSIFILFFGIVVLSGYSPAFAALLRLPTPFRSCNHFSDAAFKAGGFLILIYGVVEGLRIFLRRRKEDSALLQILIILSLLFSTAVNTYLLGPKISESLSFGLLLFWTLIFLVLIQWLRSDPGKHIAGTVYFLLAVITLDISSQSYLWIRNIVQSKVTLNSGWSAYSRIDETPASDRIGLKVGGDRNFYTNILLMYPAYFNWQVNQKDPTQIPFLASPRATKMEVEAKTFNSLRVNISLPQPDTLFVRDAYSPYWKASINGKEVSIERMMENYKSVQVPAGTHHVHFIFRPSWVPLLLALSYLGMLSALLLSIKLSHAPSTVIYQKNVVSGGGNFIL